MAKLKFRLGFKFVIACLLAVIPIVGEASSLTALQNAVDWSCINFEIVGICHKPEPPYVGIKIRYWEAALLIETVKAPGDTIIDGLGTVISKMAKEASKTLISGVGSQTITVTSGSSSQVLTQTNLRFSEVHVYASPFPTLVSDFLDLNCGVGTPPLPFIKYISELDSVEWRVGILEAISPKSIASAALGPICSAVGKYSGGLCMGFWGPVYPRRGFFIHQSEVVASAALAFRAANIASLDDFTPHIVLAPIGFIPSSDKDKLQLIYPTPSGCIRIGENPAFWEGGKTSFEGKYMWIYWRHRECCIF